MCLISFTFCYFSCCLLFEIWIHFWWIASLSLSWSVLDQCLIGVSRASQNSASRIRSRWESFWSNRHPCLDGLFCHQPERFGQFLWAPRVFVANLFAWFRAFHSNHTRRRADTRQFATSGEVWSQMISNQKAVDFDQASSSQLHIESQLELPNRSPSVLG